MPKWKLELYENHGQSADRGVFNSSPSFPTQILSITGDLMSPRQRTLQNITPPAIKGEL